MCRPSADHPGPTEERALRRGGRASATLLCCLQAMLAGPAAAGDDAAGAATAGARWFVVCGSCHGVQGEGVEALGAPRIQGLGVDYLVRQLELFRSGVRGAQEPDRYGQQMRSMSALLPDTQAVRDVAAYVGALRDPAAPGKIDAVPPDEYRLCAGCHGAAGEGNPTLGAPALAQQSYEYLLRQVEGFRRGWRGDDTLARQMRAIATSTPDGPALQKALRHVARLASGSHATAATNQEPRT